MTGALIILAVTVAVGLLLYVTDVKYFRHHHSPEVSPSQEENAADNNPTSEEICCGRHLVCEKTTLTLVSDEIIYYDDEELDRFSGRDPESYTPSETDEFRDVMLTLMPQDVAGWAKSITLRKIELPSEVKDELLLILTELRGASITPV